MSVIAQSLDRIRQELIEREESLSVAESVTSGNLQAALSLAEDATYFYQGGITAYNLGQKAKQLDIDPIAAENCNCVSERIASSMAVRTSKIFSSDWGIGVTGYAAPVPEWEIDEILFAHYSFAYKGETVYSNKVETKVSEMKTVQEFYVSRILEDFASFISTFSNHHDSVS